MNKLYPLVFILLSAMTALSQTRSWNGGNGDWNDKSKWTPVGLPAQTDILEFNGISGTVTNVPSLAFRGIIITGSDIVLNGSANDTKTLTIGYSSTDAGIVIDTDASLTIGNNLNIVLAKSAFAAVDGTLIVSSNSRYQTNAEATTKTIVNGIIRSNGGTILSSASVLEFKNGSTYEHSLDHGTIPAATWGKNSNCNIQGVVSSAPDGIDQVFGNYKWDCPHQTGGAMLGNAIPSEIMGNLVINKTGTASDPANYLRLPEKLRIDGSFLMNGGTCMVKGTSSAVDIGGDFIMTGGNLKAAVAAISSVISINFKGTTRQTIAKTGGVIERANGTGSKTEIQFNILENAVVDFGESVLNGDASFTAANGSTLITAHPEGFSATGLTGSIQVSGTRTYNSAANYVYTGSVHQVTGLGLPSVVKKLTIHNSSGVLPGAGVTLSKPTSIILELELGAGFLQTSADNVLTFLEGADAVTSGNSFVAGPMRKEGNSAFTFPTGWSGSDGGLIPIRISSMSAYSVVQAEYKRAPATNKGNTINAPLHHVSYCEYWELFPTTGAIKAIITMYRNSYSNCNPVSIVDDFSTVRVARSNGTAWTEVGHADGSMSSGNGYIVSDSSGVAINSSDRYFTLGNISSARDPLPVLFDSVSAYKKNSAVNVEWSNLTERDMAVYFVERSVNGRDYSIISQHLPKSNRDDKASYICIDPDPAPGSNYYRIKAIEKNTKIIFSRIMRVETDMPDQGFALYPNPLKSGPLVVSLSGIKEGNYIVRVISSTGQEVYSKNITNQGSYTTQSIVLPSQIKKGIYHMVIVGNEYKLSKSFIVQ